MRGLHWAIRAKENKKWRSDVGLIARSCKPKNPFHACELTFIRHSSRPTDIDNGIASLKPLIDGLKDGGIISDDNPNVVRAIHFGWEKAKPGKGFIEIKIMPIDVDEKQNSN